MLLYILKSIVLKLFLIEFMLIENLLVFILNTHLMMLFLLDSKNQHTLNPKKSNGYYSD